MIVQNIGHTLKNKQKQQVWLYSWDYTINHNEKEDETKTKQKIDHIDMTKIGLDPEMDTNVLNLKRFSAW